MHCRALLPLSIIFSREDTRRYAKVREGARKKNKKIDFYRPFR